jgi:hypothetical protein
LPLAGFGSPPLFFVPVGVLSVSFLELELTQAHTAQKPLQWLEKWVRMQLVRCEDGQGLLRTQRARAPLIVMNLTAALTLALALKKGVLFNLNINGRNFSTFYMY